jgi:Universal stress protein UspA and related nucleotide-binding proteins
MYKRILVCFDDSPTSARALQVALELAGLRGAALRIVHVVEHPGSLGGYGFGSGYGQHFLELAREQAAKLLEGALEIASGAGLPAETCLVDAAGLRLGDAVADEARSWGADLVVVGSHGRTGVQRALLGSGAEQVVRQAPVPVLVVRGTTPASLP